MIGRHGDHDHHPEQVRHAEEVAAREAGEGVVGDVDGRAVGHQQADAAQRGQRRQRDDEGRQAHAHDAEGVEHADGDADSSEAMMRARPITWPRSGMPSRQRVRSRARCSRSASPR